jgi:valyl-tRNA synthetase
MFTIKTASPWNTSDVDLVAESIWDKMVEALKDRDALSTYPSYSNLTYDEKMALNVSIEKNIFEPLREIKTEEANRIHELSVKIEEMQEKSNDASYNVSSESKITALCYVCGLTGVCSPGDACASCKESFSKEECNESL